MGSPLGPALSNIFVGYHKEKLLSEITKPALYFRYVDDTFALFQNEKESEEYLIKRNETHPSIKFTSEKEKNKCFPFFDVCFEHTETGDETSVYRKPTFTGQYVRWNSSHRLNARLMFNFDTRTSHSHDLLQEQIKRRNSPNYRNFHQTMDTQKISSQNIFPTRSLSSSNQNFGPEKCTVYLRYLFIGSASLSLERNLKIAIVP